MSFMGRGVLVLFCFVCCCCLFVCFCFCFGGVVSEVPLLYYVCCVAVFRVQASSAEEFKVKIDQLEAALAQLQTEKVRVTGNKI